MPAAAVEGAVLASKEGISVTLVGDETKLTQELAKHGVNLPIHHSSDTITMQDHASDVRRRKDSSIMQAMRLVKSGDACACVSMGHSGATMAAALLVLGRLAGVERPGILANIPTRTSFTALIDAGANADCKPVHLQQFALMGSLYMQAVHGIEKPSVGLMSIGEEAQKGNELVREAHVLLKDTPSIHFYGNTEGRDLFKGTTDVVVTDGFTGNVVLKLAEGEAKELFSWIREAFVTNGPLVKLAAAVVKPALRRLAVRLDPGEYGAQPLLGVNGYVFIGHGSSDAVAVRNALRNAKQNVEAELTSKILAGMQAQAELLAAS